MSFITKHLTQVATYWSIDSVDNSGDRTFNAPREIRVKWQERALSFTNSLGQEAVAAASVYVREDMENGEFLFLGSSAAADPRSVNGAREIQGFSKIKQLVGAGFERVAFLSARLR